MRSKKIHITGVMHKRAIAKSITFRILATLLTVGLIFFFTGSKALSLGVGAWEASTKLVLYYGHELAWDKIKWGH